MAKQEKTRTVMDEPEAAVWTQVAICSFKRSFLFTCEPPDGSRGRSR